MNASQIARIFNLLPDVYFFVKDRDGKFVNANDATANALGLDGRSDLIGKDDYDFFHKELADEYRREDVEVMESGQSIADQVWLVPNQKGDLNWYLSSKQPLLNPDGSEIVGIIGVMRGIEHARPVLESCQEMNPLIEYVQNHFPDVIEVPVLAKLVGFSVSQLERRFKKLFKITPQQYITQIRLHEAGRRLTATRDPIGQIAVECGFYDQSYFTKQFRKGKGMTPLTFRKKFSKEVEGGFGIRG